MKGVDILSPGAALDYAGQRLVGVVQKPLPTGFPSWDKACDETGGMGLGDWWYTIIGGASNAGKSTLARWLARQASECGYVPAIISMEMPRHAIQRRHYSDVSKTFGYYDLLPHKFDVGRPEEVTARVDALVAEIGEYAWYKSTERRRLLVAEVTAGRPSLSAVVDEAYRLLDEGVTHLFVDHAQLIKPPPGMDIATAAEELSEQFRTLAHQQGVATFMLSQLNRGASRERDRKPTQHDLWGGTAMESNANQVMLIDHSRNDRSVTHPHLVRTWLLLDKNREGPARVEIPVEIDYKTGLWREALPDEVDRWP